VRWRRLHNEVAGAHAVLVVLQQNHAESCGPFLTRVHYAIEAGLGLGWNLKRVLLMNGLTRRGHALRARLYAEGVISKASLQVDVLAVSSRRGL
jgi:hypothetical protein